jgi:hypothetical protein
MKSDRASCREPQCLSQITVQPLWKRAADGTVYAHAELRLRGAWLLDIFALHTRVCVMREERDGQTVLVISKTQGGDSQP